MRTATGRRHGTTHYLFPPTVLQRGIAPAGINATSAIGGAVVALRAITPAAISATSNVSGTLGNPSPPGPAQTQIQTTLALRRRTGHSKLGQPTVISAAVTSTPPPVEQTRLRITTVGVRTRGDWIRRKVQAKLNPPAVVTQPVAVPTVDQLKIRRVVPQQPRRLPARVAFISPAVVNPIVLQQNQTTIRVNTVAVRDRMTMGRRTPKSFLNNFTVFVVLKPVDQATVNATSNVSATISRLLQIVPVAFNSTSTLTGAVIALRETQPATINATSALASVTLTGATANVDTGNTVDSWISYYHYH